MPTTRTDLIVEIRENLNELSARQWSAASINRWINLGLRDISRRVEAHETTTVIPTVLNQEEYTLPIDILRINRVEYYENSSDYVYVVEPREFNGMDTIGWMWHQQSSGNTPMYYTVWGYSPAAKLILFPKPNRTGSSIKIYYYKQAIELPVSSGSDSGAIDMPEGWQDAVSDFVEYKALRKQRDPRWQESKQLYEQKVLEMQEKTIRHHNQGTTIDFYEQPWWMAGGGYN